MLKQLVFTSFTLLTACNAWATDPTAPLFGGENAAQIHQQSANLVLQSIIANPTSGTRKAIINGKLVAAGEQVLNYRVVSINGKSVKLESTEQTKILTLFAQPVATYK